MIYKKGNYSIGIFQLNGFGVNPSLWVGKNDSNSMTKVASFADKHKANMFRQWLEYMFDEMVVELPETKADEGEK